MIYTTVGVKSPERPVVPNVTAISSTEIRITWCRVHSNKVEIDHYELFIDTELEYSGVDVMYIAKRLKPWSGYEVKLRACGVSPGACSPFSRPALVMTLRDGKLRVHHFLIFESLQSPLRGCKSSIRYVLRSFSKPALDKICDIGINE